MVRYIYIYIYFPLFVLLEFEFEFGLTDWRDVEMILNGVGCRMYDMNWFEIESKHVLFTWEIGFLGVSWSEPGRILKVGR